MYAKIIRNVRFHLKLFDCFLKDTFEHNYKLVTLVNGSNSACQFDVRDVAALNPFNDNTRLRTDIV